MWMATALNTLVYPLRSGLLHGGVLPVYHWHTADVGSAFYFEQRYWLHHLQVQDQVSYRKRERREGYITRCLSEWSLNITDSRGPGGSVEDFKTNVFGSRLLIAWLFLKYRHFEFAKDAGRMALCSSALGAALAMAQQGFAHFDDLACVVVHGVPLRVDLAGHVDVAALVDMFQELPHEWCAIRDSAHSCGLDPWPGDNYVAACQLLLFVEARYHYSKHIAPTHWLRDLRNSLLRVLAFSLELQVARVLEEERCDEAKLAPAELRGKSNLRLARRGLLPKIQLLQRLMKHHGSHNTIMDTLTGAKGYSAVIRNCSNNLYTGLASGAFKHTTSLCLSHDGATYSGLNVNIGMALDCDSGFGAHVRPGVPREQMYSTRLGLCLWKY